MLEEAIPLEPSGGNINGAVMNSNYHNSSGIKVGTRKITIVITFNPQKNSRGQMLVSSFLG